MIARNIGSPICGCVASASSGRSTSDGRAPSGPIRRIASSLKVAGAHQAMPALERARRGRGRVARLGVEFQQLRAVASHVSAGAGARGSHSDCARGRESSRSSSSARSALLSASHGTIVAAASGRTSLSAVPLAHMHGTPWSAASNGTRPKPSWTRRVQHEPRPLVEPPLLGFADGRQAEHRVRNPRPHHEQLLLVGQRRAARDAGARPSPDSHSSRAVAAAARAAAARRSGSCGGSRCRCTESPPLRPASRAAPRGVDRLPRAARANVWSTPMWTTLARSGSTRSSARASARAWAEKNTTLSDNASAEPRQAPVTVPAFEVLKVGGVVVADQVLVGNDQPLAEPREKRQVVVAGHLERTVRSISAVRDAADCLSVREQLDVWQRLQCAALHNRSDRWGRPR